MEVVGEKFRTNEFFVPELQPAHELRIHEDDLPRKRRRAMLLVWDTNRGLLLALAVLTLIAGLLPAGVAWVELSTGRFCAASFPVEQCADQLARIGPVELLISDEAAPLPADWTAGVAITRRPARATNSPPSTGTKSVTVSRE